MEENESNILFSIRPKFINLILSKDKIMEYRSHYWNINYPAWFTVYESRPVCELKYRILLDSPYEPGDQIPFLSYGTEKFNNGDMSRKYAYPILKIKKLDKPISLRDLRNINVFPPQNFIYIDRNPTLKKEICRSK